MNCLLVGINAKYIHSNLAVHCLCSYAKCHSKNVIAKEYTINMQVSDIVENIYSSHPDFIGLSAYIWNIDYVINVVKDIKILLPDSIIYLGGPEATYRAEDILKSHSEIDGVMIGEGEKTLVELINQLEADSTDLSSINGIIYRRKVDNTIIQTPFRAPMNLSDVPFPYDNLEYFDNKILYYESSRGCPYGCSYCLSSVDKSIRFRDITLVKKELLFFLNKNVQQVKFVDRTFNIDHARTIELITFIKENDNGITNFHFEVAGDILSEEEIKLINSLRPGLIQLEIGVQSTNKETLKEINRHTDYDRLTKNVKSLIEGGKVHLHLDLIAGLPMENLKSFINSFNDVYSMKSHELQLGFLKVLSGAPIANLIDSMEIKYSKRAPYEVLSTKFISYEEICELKRVEEMLEIYHNSNQFEFAEDFLIPMHNTPYDFYYKMSNYYIKKGQPIIQCKRNVRYQILLSYACEELGISNDEIQKLRFLLTVDYYCREKAKARPDFAITIEEHKENIRQIDKNIKVAGQVKNYHIEPTTTPGEYIVFDYNIKSPITGNYAFNYIRI